MPETGTVSDTPPRRLFRKVHHPYRGEFHTYGVSEEQLNNLSKGIPVPLYFNFSIFFLSLAGSIIGSMLPSITLSNDDIPFLLYFVFFLGFFFLLIGCILLIKWYCINKKISTIIKDIKSLPPEGEAIINEES